MTGPRYVVDLADPGASDLAATGGKGAGLATLVAGGFPVPPGYVVTAEAYRLVAGELDLGRTYKEAGGGASGAEAARRAIAGAAVPPAVAREIIAAYDALGSEPAVAVRSSATAEDLPEASFAGQQDTYLNVHGSAAVLQHVRECWASLWTDRAVDYRERHGFAHPDVDVAVVVQVMVDADAAGVLFTANPVNGRRDQAVVNASFGLGEAVVSGLVTPDTFVVERASGRIVSRTIGSKESRVAGTAEGGTHVVASTDGESDRTALSDDEVATLVRLGNRVHDLHGSPQDIEWALAGGRIYLLQSRPVTTIESELEVDPRDEWVRGLFAEVLPDAPSPAFCSVLVPVLTRMMEFTFLKLGHPPQPGIEAIHVFYSQPYVNLRYVRAALAGLPPASRERMARRMANPFDSHQSAGRGRPSFADLAMAVRLVQVIRHLPRQLPGVVADYEARLEPARDLDVVAASSEALADEVVRVALQVVPPLVEWDFLLIAGLGFVERIVDSLVERSGVDDAAAVRGALMSGATGNVTMAANKALWQLAEAARADTIARAELEVGPPASALRRAREAGRPEFAQTVDEFLSRFGHRESIMDIATPTWGEDSTPVAGFVRAYLRIEGGAGPEAQEEAMASARRDAARDVASRLDPVRRRVFHWAVRHSAELAGERDTMHFHWTACFPVLRRLIGELGERWARDGLIGAADDAYCLHLEEMPVLARAPEPVHASLRVRREMWERDKGREWPTEIRAGSEVYEQPHVAVDSAAVDGLAGIAGSPGIGTGPAAVISSPADFGRLQRGQILVAPHTTPVWTPLFAIAGGLVTETGGILSHGAIVAREYGIPAVMGVSGATSRIADGRMVTVDGSRGLVTGDAVDAADEGERPTEAAENGGRPAEAAV